MKNRETLGVLMAFVMAVSLVVGCSGSESKPDEKPTASNQNAGESEPAAESAEPTEPAYTGRLESAPISGMGFHKAVLRLEIDSDFGATGVFEGGYDERRFNVPLEGEVAKDGQLRATGSVGPHSVVITGALTAQGLEGMAKGEIFTEEFQIPAMAKPLSEKRPRGGGTSDEPLSTVGGDSADDDSSGDSAADDSSGDKSDSTKAK